MKCPNCNTSLDHEAVVCFACGEEITEAIRQESKGSKDREFDEVIQSLILTEEEKEDKELLQRLEQKKQESKQQELWQRRYRLISFVTIGVLLLFFASLFLKWYSISGTVAFRGYFYTAQTGRFLSEAVKAYSRETLVDQTEEVATFTPNQLLTYAKEYEANTEALGLLGNLQVYYAKGLVFVYFLLLASLAVLLLDRKGRWTEVIRMSSILAVIYILLNTLAMRLPYINLLVLNAKRVLSANGVASRIVAKGLFLFESSKQELTYQAELEIGWMIAVALAALWFVLAMVLTEMSRLMATGRSLEE